MGGARETTVEQSTSAKRVSGSKIGKNLRIHENQGEVHFHDDGQNLKVAIPASIWSNAWEKYSTEMGDWAYVDKEQNTVLNLSIFQKKSKIRTNISIEKIETGNIFNSLQKFTIG